MAGYPYSKLSAIAFETRLLTLEPGDWNLPLQCHLQHSTLESAPSYEALSYTWGDAGNRREILIDGVRCTVTENLEVALRYIRRKDAARILWVDAICINQTDLGECSQQVARMLDIYKTAARVLAWTGPPSDDSDEALALLTEFGQVMLEIFKGDYSAPSDYTNAKPSSILERGFDMFSQNWSSLWNFWNRPYWNRVWIIQELACRFDYLSDLPSDVGNDAGLIGCGHHWVPFLLHACAAIHFDMFIELVRDEYIEIHGMEMRVAEPLKSFATTGVVHALRMFAAIRISSADGDNPICNLLQATRGFQATDVRDKIFALLGLSYEHNHLLPDYTKPAEAIFQDLVEFHIKMHDKTGVDSQLEILYGNRYGRDDFGPSWIPEPYGPEPLSRLFHPLYSNFSAGGGRCDPSQVRFLPDGLLSLQGCLIGVVEDVIGPVEKSIRIPMTADDVDPTVKDAYDQFRKLVPSLSQVEWTKLWRTLIGDQDASDYDDIVRPAPAEMGARAGVFFKNEPVPDDFMPESDPLAKFCGFTRPYEAQMLSNLWERRFLRTREGHMGIGPYSTEQSDLAAVLFGGVYCFVLRPVGRGYKLVGDAYVHGVMHGELLREHQAGNLASQTFTLV